MITQAILTHKIIKSPYFKAKNWNLDFKNPKGVEVAEELSSKELLERVLERGEEINGLLGSI